MNLWLTNKLGQRIWAFGNQSSQTVYKSQALRQIETDVPATFTITNPSGSGQSFTEKTPPYTPVDWQIPTVGVCQIRVSPIDQNIAARVFTLTILNQQAPPDWGKLPEITVFLVKDKDSDQPIQRLLPTDPNLFQLSALPDKVSFLIRREPVIGSIDYNFTGDFVPDPDGEPWIPRVGKSILIIQPFSGVGFSGAIGPKITIPFEIASTTIDQDLLTLRMNALDNALIDLANRVTKLETPLAVKLTSFTAPESGRYTFSGPKDFEVGNVKVIGGQAKAMGLSGGSSYTIESTGEVFVMGPGIVTITKIL